LLSINSLFTANYDSIIARILVWLSTRPIPLQSFSQIPYMETLLRGTTRAAGCCPAHAGWLRQGKPQPTASAPVPVPYLCATVANRGNDAGLLLGRAMGDRHLVLGTWAAKGHRAEPDDYLTL
jgi:hypothetical protein